MTRAAWQADILNRARISATGELVITILPGSVDRAFNEKVGLNLFRFDA